MKLRDDPGYDRRGRSSKIRRSQLQRSSYSTKSSIEIVILDRGRHNRQGRREGRVSVILGSTFGVLISMPNLNTILSHPRIVSGVLISLPNLNATLSHSKRRQVCLKRFNLSNVWRNAVLKRRPSVCLRPTRYQRSVGL